MVKAVNITVKVSNTGQLIATNPATVTSLPVSPSTRLDKLVDVDPTGEVEGGVPRYDVGTDKYIVGKLDFSDLTGDAGDIDINEIDGGEY